MEDLEQMFGTARTPRSTVREAEAMSKDTTAAKPRKNIRFSIDGQVADELADVVEKGAKLKTVLQRRTSVESADLSPVSTAPPSAVRDDVNEAEHSPEEARKSDSDTEDIVTRLHTHVESPEAFPMADGPDDEPVGGEDDDDDDLVPPPPPDSPVREEVGEETPNREDDFPIGGDSFGVDEDDEDDKEGAGFAMASSSSSASVLEEKSAAKKSKKKDKKKKKKRKAATESSDDSEEEQVKPKRKKKKVTNRFATVFSPKGVPLPREYSVVPVSDYKPSPPKEKGVRRSQRNRMKPLDWWKGECVEYGPANFGDGFDGVKNMSVPVKVRKAEPTPYKPRKMPSMAKKKTGKKSSAGDEDEPVQQAPFDSTKLRQKYEYSSSEVAHLWDECLDKADDLSKYRWCSYLCVLYIGISSSQTAVLSFVNSYRGCGLWRQDQRTTAPHAQVTQEIRRQSCWYCCPSFQRGERRE
jgi:hypothetical protein